MVILMVVASVVVIAVTFFGARTSSEVPRAKLVGWLCLVGLVVVGLRLLPGPVRVMVAAPIVGVGVLATAVWLVRSMWRRGGLPGRRD